MDIPKDASDTKLERNIYNIGSRRERAIYYKPDGTKTSLLPADSLWKMHYMSKGFTLEPPKVKDIPISGIRCPYCDFEPKNALSLRTHMTKHVGKDKEKEESE